jgi:propanol-preferring alcohol dehydrogenase
MRAYQLLEWQQAPVLHDVPVPDPGPGQVLIRVAAAGACHSDLRIMEFPAGFVP